MQITTRKCDVCGIKVDSDVTTPERITGAYKDYQGQVFEVCENCQDDLFNGKDGKAAILPEGTGSVIVSTYM